MSGKFEFTKPAETKQVKTLRLGLHLHEADEVSAEPGALFGSATLLDENQNIVFSLDLGPGDLGALAPGFADVKAALLVALGVVFKPGAQDAEAADAEAADAEAVKG